ncbi:hypothetical protein OG711_08050 [Streptomyces uncialis]|uniref:hypothetical protein n=1 Tax=Streptomyces uncialis TaxID=1048205 RepID=UPI002E375132|nr:hypothetical protein [Streptomyces uncialis]
MIVSFTVRRQAAADFGHKSTGGPVTSLAQSLHAQLYGLPADADPLPTALDALLQATHTASTNDQHAAILRRLADQLRNAAEIIHRYQHEASWSRLPDEMATRLRHAHAHAGEIADTLDHAAHAFGTPAPPTRTGPSTTPPGTTPARHAAPASGRRP